MGENLYAIRRIWNSGADPEYQRHQASLSAFTRRLAGPGRNFRKRFGESMNIIVLTPDTPLQSGKSYITPQTLGADRIAAAAGANHLYPSRRFACDRYGDLHYL